MTERVREEVSGSTGWDRLGDLLLKIGQLEKAEELYIVLLEQAANDVDEAYYYHQLGKISRGNIILRRIFKMP